jgi:heterodisulfide reductase subunit B
MSATVTERVQKGAKFLDEHIANWIDGIDVSRFELGDSCNCILGQLFSEYIDGVRHLFPVVPLGKKYAIAKTLGFDVSTCCYDAYGRNEYAANEYIALEKEWIKEIKKRKSEKCLQQ